MMADLPFPAPVRALGQEVTVAIVKQWESGISVPTWWGRKPKQQPDLAGIPTEQQRGAQGDRIRDAKLWRPVRLLRDSPSDAV